MADQVQKTLKLINGPNCGQSVEGCCKVNATGTSDVELLDVYSRVVTTVDNAVGPTVVSILAGKTAYGRDLEQNGVGLGVVIALDGYILTNSHVVHDARRLETLFIDGSTVVATLAGEDPATDLAVIRAEASDLPYAALVDSGAFRVGQLVIAIGNPLGFQSTVSTDVVNTIVHMFRG